MIIGINAAAAFKNLRTGTEEYCYQIIKYLAMLDEAKKHRFVLYGPKKLPIPDDWNLPENFLFDQFDFPIMWTQARLSAHLFKRMPNVLFLPFGALPVIHPFNSIITIHDLAYENYPEMYEKRQRRYLRLATKFSVRRSKTIIATTESVKNDLIKFYGIDSEKIEVVHYGVDSEISMKKERRQYHYILFLGRLEKNQNIACLIDAFEILKKKYNAPHKLILAGLEGLGFKEIGQKINESKYKQEIFITGQLEEKERSMTLANASLMIVPGNCGNSAMSILEAMSAGVPLALAKTPQHEEIAGNAALYFDATNSVELAEQMFKILSNNGIRLNAIKKEKALAKKFTWQRAAQKTLKILTAI